MSTTAAASTTGTSLGEAFARAFAAKDRQRIRDLIGPEFSFMALTPNRMWEADGADALLDILFDHWIADNATILAIDKLECDKFEDRECVGYRFRVANEKGEYLVEQQAFVTEKDGHIAWMRLVCSGWRRDRSANPPS